MSGPSTYMSDHTVYGDVHHERIRADKKHRDTPGGSMEDKDYDSPAWLPTLLEEVGEVARCLNDQRHEPIDHRSFLAQLRTELVQVAAMACAWADAIEDT